MSPPKTRPLSPYLIYRFGYTMTLSFLHRVTGVGLSLGLLALAWWLVALASGADAYARAIAVLSHGAAQVLLALWLVAFLYHLANGIRHLCWDAGFGLEKRAARRSALVVIVLVTLASGLLVYCLFLAPRLGAGAT